MVKQNIEKAIYQILSAKGVVKDQVLSGYFEELKSDFEHHDQSLPDVFRKLNQSLRKISMEIKSVRIEEGEERVIYHGLVNIEEDYVSKEFASPFTPEELKFFATLANTLLEKKYMNTDDILDLKSRRQGSDPVLNNFLEKLRIRGWLYRDSRNYWQLASRTYLELRAYLEASLTNGAEDDNPDVRDIINRMPQNILY